MQNFQNLIETHPVAVGLAAVWVMVWKGLALWRAAEHRARGWFIVLLVLNTLGLLEIIYLFFVTKPAKPEVSSTATNL